MISEDVRVVQHERLLTILESWYGVPLVLHEDYEDKLCWCMEHCQNKFRDVVRGSHRVWYFQNEHDATMFAMKWS
jgi:hypothetical protein